MMRLISVYLILLLTLISPAAAEDNSVPDGTIYGHVYDADTKQPVSGAWVYCQEAKCSKQTTDSDGYYAIENCFSPSSTYVIECTKNGYKSTKSTATTDSCGKAKLDFNLDLESQKSNLLNQSPKQESNPTYVTSWEKTFGGSENDFGSEIQQTSDGGYIIIGRADYSKDSRIAGNVWLIKIDSQGNTQWNRKFSGYPIFGYSVLQTSDGNYIIAGSTPGSDQSDIWLIKIDANANTLWEKTFRGSEDNFCSEVRQTSDRGYIIVGFSFSVDAGEGRSHIRLTKTDANGNRLWDRTLGRSDSDRGSSIQQTSDDGYIITGSAISSWNYDILLIKTDLNGNMEWDRTFGGSNFECGNSVMQTSDGGYTIAGSRSSNSNKSEGWLIKTDAYGNELWEKTFGGSEDNIKEFVAQKTFDGGYILAGTNGASGANIEETLLIKTDVNGNMVWERTFGDTSCSSVQQTSDGGYIVIGTKNGDLWLKKTDSEGN